MKSLGKRLWVCTGAGLVLYEYSQNTFYRYRQQNNNDESLSNNRTNCLIKDRNGTYWLGTFGSGLCYFTTNPKFKHIIIDTSLNAEDRIVYGLRTLHSGRILVSTMSQKYFMIKRDKTIHELKNSKDSISFDSIVLETTGRSLKSFPEIAIRKSVPQNDYYLLMTIFWCQMEHTCMAPVSNIINPTAHPLIIDNRNKVWILYNAYAGATLKSIDTVISFKQKINFATTTRDNNLLLATQKKLLLFDTKTYTIKAAYSPAKK